MLAEPQVNNYANVKNLRSRGVTPQGPWEQLLGPCRGQRFVQWHGKRPGRARW